MARTRTDLIDQDPHGGGSRHATLEYVIGRRVRELRGRLNLTLAELASAADLSPGMLSKIENGGTSPSLATLQRLADALAVPVTALFRGYGEQSDAIHVKAGQGLKIERRGTRAGHQYQLLGHTVEGPVVVEPYLITLSAESDVFPTFQHEGRELLYILEGIVLYRHGDRTFRLEPGDSLLFDSLAPHGPEVLIDLPIRFICVISYARNA